MEKETTPLRRLNFAGVVPGPVLLSIAVLIVCPYIVYSELQTRWAAWPALALAALFPLVGMLYTWRQRRIVDIFGIGTLTVLLFNAITLALAPVIPSSLLEQILRIAGPCAFLGVLTLFMPTTIFDNARYLAENAGATTVQEHKEKQHKIVRLLTIQCGLAQLVLAALVAILLFLLSDWTQFLFWLLIGGAYAMIGLYAYNRLIQE